VTLHPILSDSDGIPAPKISYQLGQNSEKMLVLAVAQAREAMRAAGAVEIFVNHHLRLSGYNLMGTAGMGSSAADSVVDGTGRAHDVKNLFIVDGSIFQLRVP
jgi:choline dehydrogenase-like flavoprotein